MKKERLFYLDFVRAVATVMIVLTHYNALFLYTNPQMPEKAVITLWISKVYIGDVGVTLFLIISGAALMYVYDAGFNWKEFYRKRFLSIYPMFWMAYMGAFFYKFYKNGGINPAIPRYKIIYSILGIDSYMAIFGDINYYIVGEWFLGFILAFYLIFPILRKWIDANPISLGVISIIIFCIFIVAGFPHNSVLLPVLLPRLLFGMYFVKTGKQVNWKVAVVSLAVLVLNQIMPWEIDNNIRATYVGIALFLVLVYICRYLNQIPIRKICSCICKYSYGIFIVHHIIILEMAEKMNLLEMGKLDSYLLFLCCCCVIAVLVFILQKAHDGIMSFFEK